MTALSPKVPAQGDKRDDLRAERYRALRWLWRNPQFADDAQPNDRGWVAPVTKVSTCQRHAITHDGSVKVLVTPTETGPRAGFKGLLSCGSVWACPVCSSKIAQVRAQEVGDAIARWLDSGGTVVMLTLTMRHHDGDALADLWDALGYAWNRATSGRGWKRDQETHGTPVPVTRRRHGVQVETIENRVPFLRAVEGTHGGNGWHLHVHALLFLRGDDIDADGLGKAMFQRWRTGLMSKGLAAPIAGKGGLDVKVIESRDADATASTFSEYLTKNVYGGGKDDTLAAGMEVTRGGHKKGRSGNRTPFQLLESIVQHLDDADDERAQKRAVRDVAIWREWERVSKGKRQLTWSTGLRAWLRLDVERSDDEIVADDQTTDETIVAQVIERDDWTSARRDLAGVLHAAERWYVTEYLPGVQLLPVMAEQWARSWFGERVRHSTRARVN